MEQNYGDTEKGDQCMVHITPHSLRKRTHTKSTNNNQKLVPSSSKWHTRTYRKEMTKIMKDFIWDGKKRGLMRLNYTAEIREKGGLGMSDLKIRMNHRHNGAKEIPGHFRQETNMVLGSQC